MQGSPVLIDNYRADLGSILSKSILQNSNNATSNSRRRERVVPPE